MKHQTTEEFLRTVEIESTNTYTAISHGKVIDTIRNSLSKYNIDIIKEVYTECQEGKVAQGNYVLNIGDDEMKIMLAWQNSTNKRVSFKWALGFSVTVCENGCVSGDMAALKKIHKGKADTDAFDYIEEHIAKLRDYFEEFKILKDKFKAIIVDIDEVASLVGKLFVSKKIINLTQVGIISREIENPSFDYGADNSLWQFYQHCTHSFKEVSPRTYIPKQLELSKYLQEVYL
jgi:hypothetical protein